MQYRLPVGSGPSSKTCPRCPPHLLHLTSTRFMPWLWSGTSSTPPSTAFVKLGQPLLESNLSSERKIVFPQPAQRYVPSSLLRSSSPVNGWSVPPPLRMWYCSGVNSFFHSLSDLITLGLPFNDVSPNNDAETEVKRVLAPRQSLLGYRAI